jgi:acyl carrier protein
MPNGKVDRQRLPLPTKARPELNCPYSEPDTAIESVIAKIWSDSLGIDAIGKNDNFFDLGGDSLIASKIVSTLNQIFPWSLAASEFFASPSVAGNSKSLKAKEPRAGQTDKVAQAFLRIEAMSAAEISQAVSDERLKRQQEQ